MGDKARRMNLFTLNWKTPKVLPVKVPYVRMEKVYQILKQEAHRP